MKHLLTILALLIAVSVSAQKGKKSTTVKTVTTAPVTTASTCTLTGVTVTNTADAFVINFTGNGATGYNLYVVDSLSTAPKAIINGVSCRAVTATFATPPIYVPFYISPLGKSNYTGVIGCFFGDGTYCYSQFFPITYTP